MERLMERKLALLEAEYNECINAERSRQTTADEAAMQGYGRVGAAGVQLGDDDGDDGDREEEFSPAWTQFKADMEEERARQQAEGAESDDGSGGTAGGAGVAGVAEESKTQEVRMHAPLTSDKISSIKSVMSGIKLRPPPWAIGMAEEVWMARILERAGFVRRAAAAKREQQSQQQQQQVQQQSLSEEERRKRKDKKKARKAKKAKEARQLHKQQHGTAASTAAATTAAAEATATTTTTTDSAVSPQQQPDGSDDDSKSTAAGSFTEDFETAFPAMPSPRVSLPPAAASAENVTQTA